VRGSIVSAIQSWIFYGVEVADVETSSVGTIEGAWLSFDAWMMTVLVDAEERPALSVARYSMVLVATDPENREKSARILDAGERLKIMQTGCCVHHGFQQGRGQRAEGLSPAMRLRCSGVRKGERDTSGRLRRRRHGSQNTGMAERVKPRSREAVRVFAQGFTRDDSPGEDEC
jgi:hypothetical protein